jgi:hypothetical protein
MKGSINECLLIVETEIVSGKGFTLKPPRSVNMICPVGKIMR